MKALFCHDGPVSCDKDGRFYSVGFNDKLFDRYAGIFGNISMVTRVDRSDVVSKYGELNKLTVEKYPIIEYPDYLSLRGVFANKKASTERIKRAVVDCDALIIRLPSFLGSKCVKIAEKYNKPYLIEVVGCPWDSLRNHGLSGKVIAPYLYFLTKRQVKKATDVLYVTDVFLQKRYPTKGRAVGCSDVMLDDMNKPIQLKKRKTKKEKLILGTAGVLDVRYKGQEFVIEAIAELKRMGIDAEYRLAGGGTGDYLRQKAQALGIADQVVFCGLLDRTALNAFYDDIDIYIQPSLTEGMPRAVIEAMSRGCYCLGSKIGGIPELIGKENCFKKGNVPDILRKILAYFYDVDDKNRKQCVKRSRDFDAEVLEEKRNKFYKTFRDSLVKSEHAEKQMKKVCFMINTLTGGGAERVTSLVSSNLSHNSDMEIHLITLEKKEKEYPLASSVIRHNLDLDYSSATAMIKCFFKTRKFMLSLGCDCYVGIDIFANIIVASLSVFSRRKTIISERNAPKQVAIKGIMKLLRKIFYPFAGCVVFQTEGAQKDSPKLVAKKGVIIPNPVTKNLPRYAPEKKCICAVGRLSHEKNYYLLINAFRKVFTLHPEYTLSIYGQGILEKELKAYVDSIGLTDAIRFEGFCPDVHERMKNAEIYVLSSDVEGLPNALLEAMAMGFPVIATDCPPGGPRSLIDNEKNGLLVPVGSVEAMVEAMLKYIENSDFRKSAGELAAEVNERYSGERITAAWQCCIEKMLNE